MKTIVCYGDSNTWGFDPVTRTRFERGERWTGRLQALLGEGFHVIEEGISGRTACTDDPIFPGRNGVRNIELCMLTNMPVDLVVIMLGTNDAKRHLASSAFSIARGVEMIVEHIRAGAYGPAERHPEVLVVAPMRIGENIEEVWTGSEFDLSSVSRVEQLGEQLRQVAARQSCHYLDAAQLVQAHPLDAIHLDGENHARLAVGVHDVVTALFSGR